MGRPVLSGAAGGACGTVEGKPRGYWRGCRCPECITAYRTYARECQRRKRAGESKERRPSGGAEHGTLYMYQRFGCRCAACVAAARDYHRAYRRRSFAVEIREGAV